MIQYCRFLIIIMSKERLSYSKEERMVMYEVLEDLKSIGRGELPSPQPDWDLIWVFSGPQGFQRGKKVRKGTEGELSDIGNEINESVSRMLSATKIAREVTALRLNKNVDDVEIVDIKNRGPYIFYNEWDWQNEDLKRLFWEGEGEEYFFYPKEKLIIPANTGIMHTGHQFERFPEKVLEYIGEDGKLVLLSDLYHLPRIKRYSWKKFPPEILKRMVYYPSTPLVGSIKLFLSEIKKVVEYGKKENLSWYPPTNTSNED